MMYEDACVGPCDFAALGVPSVNNSVVCSPSARSLASPTSRLTALSLQVNLNPQNNASGVPQKNWFSQSDAQLTGFDRDFIDLVFARMLNLPYQFHAFASITEMNFGLLSGKCDVAVTASQIDPAYAICPDGSANTSTAMLYDYGYGDYAAGLAPFGRDGISSNFLKCLQYGAPYITSGFALASILVPTPFDVTSAVFNADVGNAATVILLIGMVSGYIVAALERTNTNLGTAPRGAYWALFTYLLVSEEDPRSKPGRVIMVVYMLANIVSLCILTSIISAKLTTTSLSVTYIQQLSDVTGPLCVESNYAVLSEFVLRQPSKPSIIVYATLDVCMTWLQTGNVTAVITDSTVLNWYSSYYSVTGAYVSPVLQSNPFAFVYANQSNGLMQYINPAVVAATLTDADWIPATQALFTKYFGVRTGVIAPFVTQIDYPTFIAAMALSAFPLLCAFLNGDWGRGIFKYAPEGSLRQRFRHFIARPYKNSGESDRVNALKGDELSQVRYYMAQFDLLAAKLDQLELHCGLVPVAAPEPEPTKEEMVRSASLLKEKDRTDVEGGGGVRKGDVDMVSTSVSLEMSPATSPKLALRTASGLSGLFDPRQLQADQAALLATLLSPMMEELRELRREVAELRDGRRPPPPPQQQQRSASASRERPAPPDAPDPVPAAQPPREAYAAR